MIILGKATKLNSMYILFPQDGYCYTLFMGPKVSDIRFLSIEVWQNTAFFMMFKTSKMSAWR